MKVIERFEIYIKNKGLSLNSIDVTLNLSNGYIGRQIKNKASIGSDILQKIISTYTDLNIVWLLTGEGEMLYSDGKTFDNKVRADKEKIILLQEEVIKGRDEIISHLKTQIAKLRARLEKEGIKADTVLR